MYLGFQNDTHVECIVPHITLVMRKAFSELAPLLRQLKTTADTVLEKECVQPIKWPTADQKVNA